MIYLRSCVMHKIVISMSLYDQNSGAISGRYPTSVDLSTTSGAIHHIRWHSQMIQACEATNQVSYICLLRPTLYHGFLPDYSGAIPQNGPCFIRVIGEIVMPRALAHFASLQREHPKIALEISCRHRQRLTLSWCSSTRMRNAGLQIKIRIYFDDFLFMLEVAQQYWLKGPEAGSNICFYHAVLATQALDGGISSLGTMTRS
jgi:hypothetical protein